MMRPIASLAVVLALPVVVAAAADQTASPGKGLTNPFFPYSVGGVSDDVLREMNLKKLKAAGYTGPIGLQCYGLKGDPLVHLRQSIAAWKAYSARLAGEP